MPFRNSPKWPSHYKCSKAKTLKWLTWKVFCIFDMLIWVYLQLWGPSLPCLWQGHWCWPALVPLPLWCRARRSCDLCDHSWWSLSTTPLRPSSVHDLRSHYTCQREEKEQSGPGPRDREPCPVTSCITADTSAAQTHASAELLSRLRGEYKHFRSSDYQARR